jgi:hypothetical protein
MIHSDALTTERASTSLRAAGRLFLASLLVKETRDMNQQTLNSAIIQFAFAGMLAPHRREYEAPRQTTTTTPSQTPKQK